MKKVLIFTLIMFLAFAFTLTSNVQDAEAASTTTTTTWKSGCDKNKWPYKTKPLSNYNPCLIHIQKTYFSNSELSKISADLGLGGGLFSLGQAGYNKLAKELGKRAIGGTGIALSATAIGVGAEVMYRSAKSQGIKGWNIERRYVYEVRYGVQDLFPTKKIISNKYLAVKK